MNKKIISGLILGSAIVLPLSVVAVSWSTEQKANDQSIVELKSVENQISLNVPDEMINPIDIEQHNYGFPEYTKEVLNAEAKKVTIDYPEKEKINARATNFDRLEISGYDASKFYFSLNTIEADDSKGELKLTFKIVSLRSINNSSDFRTIIINGFKKPFFSIFDWFKFY